jgi:hypothetical protein
MHALQLECFGMLQAEESLRSPRRTRRSSSNVSHQRAVAWRCRVEERGDGSGIRLTLRCAGPIMYVVHVEGRGAARRAVWVRRNQPS